MGKGAFVIFPHAVVVCRGRFRIMSMNLMDGFNFVEELDHKDQGLGFVF